MNHLPGPTPQPTAPQPGQPNPAAEAFLADVEDALSQVNRPQIYPPTFYRNNDPVPAFGPTPPAPPPGARRAPMSEKATDDSVRMISAGFLTLCTGCAASGILYFSGHANPTVIGMICAAPIALAVPIAFLSRLVKRVKETVEAAPPVINQHYNGPVTVIKDQRTVNSTNRGIVATTRNELPPTHRQDPTR